MSRSRSRGWFRKHSGDPYVRQARAAKYRARSAFKLAELDRREKLFRPGQTIIDLGAAPGSWSQYARERLGGNGRILAIDRLAMDPIEGVDIIQGDLADPGLVEQCMIWLGEQRADLVISDAAPNLTGINVTDQANMVELARLLSGMARQTLKPGGHFLIKLFQGVELDAYVTDLREHFREIVTRKPQASKDASREVYVLARGYNV
ncbi:MAG: RlmE family RNA methyltransferase [Gammaproteobacteria bacterium]|nr:RlmE family RNA methyltransferase [Gammaproteobacteria bacterium]